ncbi:MAG: response regulator transcription factor [Acidobacteriaceae bacterium]
MKAKLLVVDDEIGIHKVIASTLGPLGFDVVGASHGEEALSAIRTAHFDTVLLDINMPGMSGIATCRAIRRIAPALPVLILTARNSVDDKVEALEAGADDYVTKPFAIRELVARVNAAIRRGQSPALPIAPISVGDVSLCSKERVFLKRGNPVPLTRTQFDILHLLISNQGRPVTHKKILTTIWGAEFRDHLEYLRTYVRELRKRIEDDPAHPEYLLTAPCVGYRFRG